MKIRKKYIVQFLKDKGQTQQADQAADELPDDVDPTQHPDLLAKYGIDARNYLESSPSV